MSTKEFWLEFDVKMKAQKQLQKTAKNKVGFTEEEWAAARRKFSERNHDATNRPSR